ncbi:MAG TPA: potassium/proton antiporter [Vicinamibacterales bacterium]|nr:potassium/proton antiporter [Vicinamibacterales bacterium]
MTAALLPFVLAAAGLLLASVFASKITRLGIPALLLFMAVGMLAGSDGPGGIPFDNPALAQGLGVLALAFILFSGGLDTSWEDIRPVAGRGLALATVGVVLTAGLTGLFAWWVTDLPLSHGLLLGAIVSSTDAAAVFSVLRSRNVRLPSRLRSLLELESGSNDPMAIFLTVALIGLIASPGSSPAGLIGAFFWQMAFGAAFGVAMGRLTAVTINAIRLEYDGLYPVLLIAAVLLIYGVTDAARGNPFLAVYLAAIVLRRQSFVHKRSLIRFYDGLAWLAQIVMFLALGLQVFPSRLPAVAGEGFAIAAFLTLVARPAAVTLTLLPLRLPWREVALTAWVGLRGAAPIILATFPLVAGIPQAERLFEIVFFIVLTSALVQGTSVSWLAERLGLSRPSAGPSIDPLEMISAGEREFVEVQVRGDSPIVDRRVLEFGLPPGALVVVLDRAGQTMVPSGGTRVQAGDKLLVMTAAADARQVRERLEKP